MALAVAVLAGAPASAAATMTAKDFNLFVFHDVNEQGSDTEGRVAVGHDANFLPYSVAAKAGSGTNLVVGHNLNYTNDTFKGSMVVGGTATLSGVGVNGNVTANGNISYSNGTISGALRSGGTVTTSGAAYGSKASNQAQVSLPVDFSAEEIRLKGLSTLYSTYTGSDSLPVGATLGTYSFNSSSHALTLTGSGSGLVVFNIDASLLPKDWGSFAINITGGGEALVNVSGSSIYWTGGTSFNGSSDAVTAGANTLFNFYQATNVTFGSIGVLGSVLAPLATYNDPTYDKQIGKSAGGVIWGQVVMNNWDGSYSSNTQVNNVFLRDYALGKNLLGDPLPVPLKQGAVPEPSTWMTMVAGFGVLGGALRRRRRKAVLA